MTAPIASGWSVAGWDLHPLESAAFARRTPDAVIRAVAKFYYWSRGVFAKPRAGYQHSKEFTRIWAGSTALRRPGWRFRFDDRDEHLGAIDHNAHRSCYA